jgi:hypothetical protein
VIDLQVSGACSAAPVPEAKMYVLVRRDLPWPVRVVQATHGVMQLLRTRWPIVGWGKYGPAVVLLGVADEESLTNWLARLPGAVGFSEPDLCDSLTAVAYLGEPIEALSELRLM